MPEIQLSRVVSVSSADPLHPAENLLQPDGGGRWRGAAGEKQISVVLELAAPRRVQRLHIGNDGAAFVEVLVGTAAEGSFQVLLPSAAFMSPRESRAGEQPQRVRLFGPEALVGGGAEREWDRVRLVCSQPYCQSRPFGLSFIRLFSPPEGDDPPTAAPVRRLGPFTVREEGGSPRRPPGALFYQRPPSPTAPSQPPPGPSYAVATLQASAGPSPKPPKRRPPPPTPPKTNGTPRKRPTPPSPRGAAPPPTSGTPPPRSGTPPLPPPTPILEGVVLVLSGFQNPLRGQLRAAALSLGATYRPEWTPDSTHLVCAFPRTPKAARARGLGGLLVGPAWIWDCQRQQRRLPVGPYLLDGAASSDSEGDGPEDAPPPPRPHPTPKAPPTTTPPPSGAPADPVTSDPAGSGSDEASSDSDQWERDDPYGGSTEENSEEGEGQEEPIPPLPDFFAHQTFLFHGGFAAGEGRRLRRYVIAFGGTVAPYMNDSVTHVVTAQEWDPAFEEALELRPSLIFVRPRWLLLCGERQRPLPAQPYAVVPRP